MTVAITQEHNEARLAGTLSFLDAGTNNLTDRKSVV